MQPVGGGSSREYKTKLAGEVSGRHKAGFKVRRRLRATCACGRSLGGQERNHMFTALSSARHYFAHIRTRVTFVARRVYIPILYLYSLSLKSPHQSNQSARQAYCEHYTSNSSI